LTFKVLVFIYLKLVILVLELKLISVTCQGNISNFRLVEFLYLISVHLKIQ